MKKNVSSVFISSIVGAFTSFLLFTLIYFIYAIAPYYIGGSGGGKITLFAFVCVIPVGGFIAGRIVCNAKLGVFSGLFASLGFFIFSMVLIISTFYWDHKYNLFFFTTFGVDMSDYITDVTSRFIWGHGLLICVVFTVISLLLNALSGFLGGISKSIELN